MFGENKKCTGNLGLMFNDFLKKRGDKMIVVF